MKKRITITSVEAESIFFALEIEANAEKVLLAAKEFKDRVYKRRVCIIESVLRCNGFNEKAPVSVVLDGMIPPRNLEVDVKDSEDIEEETEEKAMERMKEEEKEAGRIFDSMSGINSVARGFPRENQS